MDNEERRLAGQLLQECQEEIVKYAFQLIFFLLYYTLNDKISILLYRPILQENGPIEIKLCGVEYMNDDPSEVDVLYGKVTASLLFIISQRTQLPYNSLRSSQSHYNKLPKTSPTISFRPVSYNVNMIT